MCFDTRRAWFVSVMTAGYLVCGHSRSHNLTSLKHWTICFDLWPQPVKKSACTWTWVCCCFLQHIQGEADKRCISVYSEWLAFPLLPRKCLLAANVMLLPLRKTTIALVSYLYCGAVRGTLFILNLIHKRCKSDSFISAWLNCYLSLASELNEGIVTPVSMYYKQDSTFWI